MILKFIFFILKLLRVQSFIIVSIMNLYLVKPKYFFVRNEFINKENYALNSYGKKNVITREKKVAKNNDYVEIFVGRLTSYSPKCKGCSSSGNVACKTKNGKSFSLIKDGQYYNDKEYGKIRIVAAATTKFKCGTVMEIKKKGKTPVLAVVLDTGGSMRNAWKKKKVWIDLAYTDSKTVKTENLTGRKIEFKVLRYGW